MRHHSAKKTESKKTNLLAEVFKPKSFKCPRGHPFFEVIKEVKNILGINDLEYKKLVFELGLKWIDQRGFKNPKEAVRLSKRRWFWDLFEPQYNLADVRFLEKVYEDELFQLDRKELLQLYIEMHLDIVLDSRTKVEKLERVIKIIEKIKTH